MLNILPCNSRAIPRDVSLCSTQALSQQTCQPTRNKRLLCEALSGSGKGHRRRAGKPGLFEVKDVSPPPRLLGIHSLPPDTHNGDQIEVEGQDYVVDSVTLHYKLVGGKYQREHNQLAVHSTSRFFLNKYLDHMYKNGSNKQKP
ncbi:hypothetical protein WJX77_005851 [Trebouxia sp. C0004]